MIDFSQIKCQNCERQGVTYYATSIEEMKEHLADHRENDNDR